MHRSQLTRTVHRLALAAAVAFTLPAMAGPAAALHAAESKAQEALVDINTAGVEELMSVPGIGQVIAQRIVEYRDKNGPYASVDDLLKIQGIGEKSLARIRERLTAGKARK
jgi:competence protein ComEA